MNRAGQALISVLVIAVTAAVAPGQGRADKPEWAGKKHEDRDRGNHDRGKKEGRGEYFEERHRVAVHDYYEDQFRAKKKCPPGLAKKRDGCLPPGQAKKWQVGKPLPRDVRVYDVPSALVVKIGPPPSGYRYVRVAADILMIATGTRMVVDAIQDLGTR